MIEIWKPIPGWESLYEVSDQGRVKSLHRSFINARGHHRIYPEAILSGRVDTKGYHRHRLRNGPRAEEPKTHQLVAWAFLGPQAEGLQVCHNDGNPLNNHLSNLRYDTQAGNQADRKLHGTDSRGEKHGRAKLNETQARLTRRLKDRKGCTAEVARQWGVAKESLYYIQKGKNWSHLQ